LTPELVALTVRDVLDDGPEPGWTPLRGDLTVSSTGLNER
jgi:hypothetical protein